MKAKSTNIVHTVDAHHRVAVKMDKSCGINQLTITSGKGVFVVGSHPGSKIRKYTREELIKLLEENSMFIESWKAV